MTTFPRSANGRFQETPPSTKNLSSERTAAQRPGGGFSNGYNPSYAPLGAFSAPALSGMEFGPFGLSWFGENYSGSYQNYRWMLQHPIIRLVRSIAVGPILSSAWEYEKARTEVPDTYTDMVRRNLDPIRSHMLQDFFVPGRDYGWAGGEPIWESTSSQKRAETRLVRVKPLLHEVTRIRHDPHGNFSGLENYVAVEGENESPIITVAPFKAFLYTYDSYAGYLYGRSWLENLRTTAWADWMATAQQLNKVGLKVSNTFLVVKTPSGTYPDKDGNRVSYKESALQLIADASAGAPGAWIPSLALSVNEEGKVDALKMMAELASKSLTDLDALDFGNHSASIKGLLERMVHDEELMFAGGLRPSRSGLEGEHGTKSSAEIHTDTGTTNAEIEDSSFADAMQPLVDAVLVVNFGEIAKGTVRINPPPLVARLLSTVKALLLAGMNVPEIAAEMLASFNVDQFAKVLGVQQKRPFNAEAALANMQKQQASSAPKNVEPQGGRPPVNG